MGHEATHVNRERIAAAAAANNGPTGMGEMGGMHQQRMAINGGLGGSAGGSSNARNSFSSEQVSRREKTNIG
jgi:hypothetical protein